jgi:uncharacterized lipoprotein YajG
MKILLLALLALLLVPLAGCSKTIHEVRAAPPAPAAVHAAQC